MLRKLSQDTLYTFFVSLSPPLRLSSEPFNQSTSCIVQRHLPNLVVAVCVKQNAPPPKQVIKCFEPVFSSQSLRDAAKVVSLEGKSLHDFGAGYVSIV